MRLNIDTILDLVAPLTGPKLSPLVLPLLAYYASPYTISESWQHARAKPQLREKLRLISDELLDVIKSNRWLKYYAIFALLRILNRLGSAIFMERRLFARKINWKDHTVVISGGARGIGGRVCEMLKERGATVVVIDRASKSAHSREDLFISADVSNENDMTVARATMHKEVGYATMIISAAGIARHAMVLDPPSVFPSDFSTKVHQVNLNGTYTFVKVFGQDMLAEYDEHLEVKLAKEGKLNKTQQMRVEGKNSRNGFGGHILLIGSGAAFIPLPGNATYNASKAAIVSLHHTLGWELDVWHKAKNVRNSVFCPLMIHSDMTKDRMKEQRNQFLFPTLTVDQAAGKIVKVLEEDRSQMFFMPRAAYVSSTVVMNSPAWIVRPIFKLLGAPDTFMSYARTTRYPENEH